MHFLEEDIYHCLSTMRMLALKLQPFYHFC